VWRTSLQSLARLNSGAGQSIGDKVSKGFILRLNSKKNNYSRVRLLRLLGTEKVWWIENSISQNTFHAGQEVSARIFNRQITPMPHHLQVYYSHVTQIYTICPHATPLLEAIQNLNPDTLLALSVLS
jgi:hypothetical protein